MGVIFSNLDRECVRRAEDMPNFLVQWKFTAESFSSLRNNPQDRLATSISFAESYGGAVVSLYNRFSEYDGMGIFLFPDVLRATAHSVHAMSTGAFLRHDTELLLTSAEYKDALTISRDAKVVYQPPNVRFGRGSAD
jgi:uncharacterized protein with GYD domain